MAACPFSKYLQGWPLCLLLSCHMCVCLSVCIRQGAGRIALGACELSCLTQGVRILSVSPGSRPSVNTIQNLGENIKRRRHLVARATRFAGSLRRVSLGPKGRWQQYAGTRPATLRAVKDKRACNILRCCITSSGWTCAIVGGPRPGSVAACLAWGDLFVSKMFQQVLRRLSLLRHHGTPMMARLQLPELQCPCYPFLSAPALEVRVLPPCHGCRRPSLSLLSRRTVSSHNSNVQNVKLRVSNPRRIVSTCPLYDSTLPEAGPLFPG